MRIYTARHNSCSVLTRNLKLWNEVNLMKFCCIRKYREIAKLFIVLTAGDNIFTIVFEVCTFIVEKLGPNMINYFSPSTKSVKIWEMSIQTKKSHNWSKICHIQQIKFFEKTMQKIFRLLIWQVNIIPFFTLCIVYSSTIIKWLFDNVLCSKTYYIKCY